MNCQLSDLSNWRQAEGNGGEWKGRSIPRSCITCLSLLYGLVCTKLEATFSPTPPTLHVPESSHTGGEISSYLFPPGILTCMSSLRQLELSIWYVKCEMLLEQLNYFQKFLFFLLKTLTTIFAPHIFWYSYSIQITFQRTRDYRTQGNATWAGNGVIYTQHVQYIAVLLYCICTAGTIHEHVASVLG